MYSSLHKIDLVAAASKGEPMLLVQTDHRPPAEVGADQGLSMIFALTRMLMPRSGDYATATVRYACIGEAHPLLESAAAACAAELESAGQRRDLSAVPRQPPEDLADAAFASVGRRVLGERKLAVDEAGLTELVAEMASPPTRDDDEVAYYTAMIELAAATGEVVRARFGGRWVRDTEQYSAVPFIFLLGAGGDHRVNVAGKVENFFRHGEFHSPVLLLRVAEDSDLDGGPLLFSLKPSGWEAAATQVTEPIATGLDVTGADVPLMVYGHDRPNTFAMLGKTTPDLPPLATLRAQALHNLAAIEVEIEPLDDGASPIRIVHGSYFAAEKILDAAFLRGLHAELASSMLAVAVPAKERLLVTAAIVDVEAMQTFFALARSIYDADEDGRQLSPTVFLVSDGAIVGVATPSDAPAPPKKRGFWRRLFGRG